MTATLGERAEAPVDTPPPRRGTLSTLTHRDGDVPISWDPQNADEVQVARTAFRELLRTHLLYQIGENGEREQVREFDPQAARIVAVPPLKGG